MRSIDEIREISDERAIEEYWGPAKEEDEENDA